METDTSAPLEGTGIEAGDVTMGSTDGSVETAPVETETAPVVATPPPQPTPEEIEERAFQRTASWMGRREKEFSDNILRNVTQVLDSRLANLHPAAPAPSTDPATMLENPDAWLEKSMPRVLDKFTSERTRADQAYMGDFIREAGSMMDSDPLFQGEEGKKLGSEVVAEVQKNIGSLDRSIPAGMAAKLFIANSALNVVRQRTAVRQNALAGNRPATGIGTVKAPGAPTAGKPAPVKLDDMAKKVANWFGNSEAEVREFLK